MTWTVAPFCGLFVIMSMKLRNASCDPVPDSSESSACSTPVEL